MPLVRVVIPTYNRASLLADALQSALLQSFSDFEVIVVDDGSTDDTDITVQRFSAIDSRVLYRKQPNSGVASARNRAIQEFGQHTYIAFLDSDDRWFPQHLAESISVLECEPTVSLLFSVVKTVDLTRQWTNERIEERNRRIRSPLKYSRQSSNSSMYCLEPIECFRALLRSDFVPHPSTVVVRRDDVSRADWFNSKLEILEDVEFFLHLAKSHVFGFLDSVHAEARYHGDNLTVNQDLSSALTLRRYQSVLQYQKRKLKVCTRTEDSRFVSKEIAETAYLIGQCAAEQLDLGLARRAYVESLHYSLSRKSLKGVAYSSLPRAAYNYLRDIKIAAKQRQH